jgi:hypothetical protein
MKTAILLILVQVCSLLTSSAFSQENSPPLFGKDIIINDQPDQDQENIAICATFNGWLYAVYSYKTTSKPRAALYKSTDNGLTWVLLFDDIASTSSTGKILKLELVACGNSVENLKLFLAVTEYDSAAYMGKIAVLRYKCEPYTPEGSVYEDISPRISVSIAGDNQYPSVNSNPFSFCALVANTGIKDSLILYTSSNGGLSFDNKKIVTLTNNVLRNIDVDYGRSLSWNTGRYFVTWEERLSENAAYGQIYTSHSEPNFNSPFTAPFRLDNLDPVLINKCRKPVICCQSDNIDNASGDLTEMVLFEKFDQVNNNYGVTGYYNLKSVQSSNFYPLTFSNPSHINLQPQVAFNNANEGFMLTYFDSTTQKLPLLINDLNSPNTFTITTDGYNGDSILLNPQPSVKYNPYMLNGINAWISNRTNGNGMAMFDATYSTYTGINNENRSNTPIRLASFPNPCSTIYNIEFELPSSTHVKIQLLNVFGENLAIITDQTFSRGKHLKSFDVSKYPAGIYCYTIITDFGKYSGKIHIQH